MKGSLFASKFNRMHMKYDERKREREKEQEFNGFILKKKNFLFSLLSKA
jgi:hypothetical protein